MYRSAAFHPLSDQVIDVPVVSRAEPRRLRERGEHRSERPLWRDEPLPPHSGSSCEWRRVRAWALPVAALLVVVLSVLAYLLHLRRVEPEAFQVFDGSVVRTAAAPSATAPANLPNIRATASDNAPAAVSGASAARAAEQAPAARGLPPSTLIARVDDPAPRRGAATAAAAKARAAELDDDLMLRHPTMEAQAGIFAVTDERARPADRSSATATPARANGAQVAAVTPPVAAPSVKATSLKPEPVPSPTPTATPVAVPRWALVAVAAPGRPRLRMDW